MRMKLAFVGGLCCSLLLITGLTVGVAAEGKKCLSKTCASGVEVSLTFPSERLTAYKPVEVTLTVFDAKHKPISNALIYCSFFMPNYATGSNKPKLKAIDQAGTYSGIVFFEREGDWLANFTINLPGGGYEEVTFEIPSVLPASG